MTRLNRICSHTYAKLIITGFPVRVLPATRFPASRQTASESARFRGCCRSLLRPEAEIEHNFTAAVSADQIPFPGNQRPRLRRLGSRENYAHICPRRPGSQRSEALHKNPTSREAIGSMSEFASDLPTKSISNRSLLICARSDQNDRDEFVSDMLSQQVRSPHLDFQCGGSAMAPGPRSQKGGVRLLP